MSFQHSSLSAFPRPQTSLVGRTTETAAIHELLPRPAVRLVTLTGPGGAGKTRLALHAALTADGFPDGRWFVELAGVTDPALVVPQIAQVIGLREQGNRTPLERITSALDGKTALLVLDNLEHLLDGVLAISQLSSHLPGLTILATSRSPLTLAHEYVIAVGALDVATTAQGQEQSDAVELFRQRARAIRPGYDPGPADLRAIEAICIQLGGLPLAIELAAARIRVMSPQALQARLSQPLRVLAAGPHDAPARHRSMRDAIDWSYRLLPAEQRALLRAMGVFSGSVPLDGIEQVAHAAGIATAGDLIELLARLADASMIEPVEREQAEPRFQILATVREFLVEELERDGELVSMQDLHAGWIESLSASLAGRFERPQEHFAFARSRAELSNIRAALGWSLEQGATARAVRIAGNLTDFWSFGGQSSEGRRWVERIIPVLERQPLTDRERFQFWVSAGLIAWSQGDAKEATQRYTCALELARSLTDVDQARAHMWLAQSAWYEGDYQQMATHARDAIDIAPEKCVPGAGARTLLGIAEMRLDHLDEAERVLTTAQALHAEIGFTRAAIWTLQLLGDLALLRGDYSASAKAHRESLALALESTSPWGIFEDLSGLIALAVKLGWTAEALELLASAELLMTQYSIVPREGLWLSPDDAARLKAGLTSQDLQRLAHHAATCPMPQLVERASDIALGIERGRLQAIAAPKAPARTARSANPFALSPREQTVLALLADGKTDRQIGAELNISHGTARSHVTHVLQKLDARNRAAAVRKALELDLV